jgi:hypothetical protein
VRIPSPKGRLYIESSPVGFFGASKYYPRVYQWEYLLRYGLTDNFEFRIFSNGLTAQASQSAGGAATGEQTEHSGRHFDQRQPAWRERQSNCAAFDWQ